MEYINFEPRKWKAQQNEERIFVTDMCGGLTEVFCLGDWHKNWYQIDSPHMALEAETDYTFTFWLNGGENDRRQEKCKLKVYLAGDSENPLVFRLNRSYIKPDRHNNGWYRYEIPFKTPPANDGADIIPVMLQFATMDAPCAIMPDKPEFAQLPHEDPPTTHVPQRHNIVFESGFPDQRNTVTDRLHDLGFDLDGILHDLPDEDKVNVLNNIINSLHL